MDNSKNKMLLPSFQIKSPSIEQIIAMNHQMAHTGEYLLAIFSLYRALGKTVDQFLQKHAPFTDWNSGIYHGIEEKFLHVRNEIHPHRHQLPSSLGFSDSLFIIHIIDLDLISFSTLKMLILLSENRHKSWLAHGTFTPGRKEFLSMINVYLPLIHSLINQIKEGSEA